MFHRAPRRACRGDRRGTPPHPLAAARLAGTGHGSARAVGSAHDAHVAGGDRDDGGGGEGRRLQHPARSGARPRRRVFPERASSRAPASLGAQPSFDPLRGGHREGARCRAARARVGQRQPGRQRERAAGGARPRRLPSSRVADGSATRSPRSWPAVDPRSPGYLGRLARYVTRASRRARGTLSVAGVAALRAAYDVGRARHRRALRRSTASISTTSATHATISTTAATRLTAFRDVGRGGSRRGRSAPLRRRRLADHEPLIYTQAFPERWRAFRTARLTALLASLGKTAEGDQAVGDRQRRAWCPIARGGGRAPAAGLARMASARGLVDVICPMAYTTDAAAVRGADCDRRARSPARTRCGPESARIGCRPRRSSSNVQTARPPRRRRRHPLLVRQPGRSGARPGLPRAGRPRRVPHGHP